MAGDADVIAVGGGETYEIRGFAVGHRSRQASALMI
jgi:hypothetical protein